MKNKVNNKITSSPNISDTYLNRKCDIESVKYIITKVKLARIQYRGKGKYIDEILC